MKRRLTAIISLALVLAFALAFTVVALAGGSADYSPTVMASGNFEGNASPLFPKLHLHQLPFGTVGDIFGKKQAQKSVNHSRRYKKHPPIGIEIIDAFFYDAVWRQKVYG